MQTITYKTAKVCSKEIEISVEGDKIRSVAFTGGCNGNLKGIASLVKGMDIDVVIGLLEGTTCDKKNTSCPDQLARALKKIKENR